jgi:hypothetical protein
MAGMYQKYFDEVRGVTNNDEIKTGKGIYQKYFDEVRDEDKNDKLLKDSQKEIYDKDISSE